MASTTDKAWDGSASRWEDAKSYCGACLINLNDGPSADWTKDACKLPTREPSGEINTNALSAALAALNGARGSAVDAPPAARKKAARKLASEYRAAGLDVPATLRALLR